MSGEELVTAAVFHLPNEAELAKSRLLDFGINSTMTGQDAVTLFSHAVGGVRLLVFSRDLAAAQEILEEDDSGAAALESLPDEYFADQAREDAEEDEDVDDENDGHYRRTNACPYCGSDATGMTGLANFNVIFDILLFGFPWLFFETEYGCQECGHTWKR